MADVHTTTPLHAEPTEFGHAERMAELEQARRLGYVHPGERLFIVKGVSAWVHSKARATIGGGG